MFGRMISFIAIFFLILSLFVFVCTDSMISASAGRVSYVISLIEPISSYIPLQYMSGINNLYESYFKSSQKIVSGIQLSGPRLNKKDLSSEIPLLSDTNISGLNLSRLNVNQSNITKINVTQMNTTLKDLESSTNQFGSSLPFLFKSIGYSVIWNMSIGIIIFLTILIVLLNLSLFKLIRIFGSILVVSGLLILFLGPLFILSMIHFGLGLSLTHPIQNNPFISLVNEAMISNVQVFLLVGIVLLVFYLIIKILTRKKKKRKEKKK